ncbi:MAG: CRISPR-associated endonuclease Cas2 [Anaerolineae bacterium]
MQCVIVYDIPDDRLRAKVADICLDYGLERIQYSAFAGSLQPSHIDELLLKIKKRAAKKAANIQIFPLCTTCWKKRREWKQTDPSEGKK